MSLRVLGPFIKASSLCYCDLTCEVAAVDDRIMCSENMNISNCNLWYLKGRWAFSPLTANVILVKVLKTLFFFFCKNGLAMFIPG